MKRHCSSDSLGGLMSICPNSTEEHNQGNNPVYSRDFQTMLDGLDEESGHVSEKKRRLSVDQVKALEKNFEVENKLEPERKVKLAQELGLQPRQVAVWFQNRRARWKTKQLDRDYAVLKSNYDSLKLNFETLQSDNDSLLKQIQELKSKLNGEGNSDGKVSVKEEPIMSSEKTELENSLSKFEEAAVTEVKNCSNGGMTEIFDLKDGSSDSDSSAILNEENNNSPTADLSSSIGILGNSPHQFLDIHSGPISNTSLNISFQFSDAKASVVGDARKAAYQAQFVKIEEHNFFGVEGCTTFFSDDQAPTLHWYSSDDWN